VEKLCGKIAPKNCAEKFARKKKKMGQVLQLKMESENCRALKIKKSITHLLPTNFFFVAHRGTVRRNEREAHSPQTCPTWPLREPIREPRQMCSQ
jgi:hemolysin-activating ACP:hemolysin acyltransferase